MFCRYDGKDLGCGSRQCSQVRICLHSTFALSESKAVEQQQVGGLWQGEFILSLSLSGDINYWDRNSQRPVRVITGHQKAITALDRASDNTLYTGSYDGRVCAWDSTAATVVTGSAHTNQVTGIAVVGDLIATVGMDDTHRTITNKAFSFVATNKVAPLPPRVLSQNQLPLPMV